MSNDQYPGQQAAPSQPMQDAPWGQVPEATGPIPQQPWGSQPVSAPSATEYSGQIPQQPWGAQPAEPTQQIPTMGAYQQAPTQPASPGAFSIFSDVDFNQVKTPLIAKFTWIMIIIATSWAWLLRVLFYFRNLKDYRDQLNSWMLLGGIGELIFGLSIVFAVIFGSRMVIEALVRYHKQQDSAGK